MQLETGGYGIDGTAIESGGTHTAANGNYTLTMEDGVWMATFAPAMHEVALGASGDSVTIVQMEAGGFSLNGEAITADTTAMAANGATYGVALGADGPMVVYIPSSVTVMLGMEGGELMLTLAEDQMTYMRDGEVFAPGTVVTSNERDYTVTMGEGGWMADFNKPMVDVALGGSGNTITLIQDEQRGWWYAPEQAANDGDTYTMGANNYSMMLADGVWTATFAPNMMEVTLGMSGESITVTQVEAGGYMYNDMMIGDGAYAKAENGASYSLMMGEDGTIMASYTSDPVSVMLGTEGGTIMLVLQEDQMTWHKDGEVFMSGGEVMVMFDDRTNTYTVTMDAETGMWSAAYVHFIATIDLGTSGETQDLIRDEMGGWWTDPDNAFSSGGTVMAANGNSYTLTYGEEGWSSVYVPATMAIMGTDLTAVANENDGGYTIMGVADQTLDENGMGDVMTDAGNFRVHMDDDGNLVGTQYEEAVNTEAAAAKARGFSIGTGVAKNKDVVNVDDAKTEGVNEAGTMITINGDDHSIGDLFQDGETTVEGTNIIAAKDGVLATVSTLAAQIKGLIAVNTHENPDGDGTQTDFSESFRAKWKALDTALDAVFGNLDETDSEGTVYDHIDPLDDGTLGATAVEKMVETLDAIVMALSSADAFLAAALEDGIFEDSTAGGANAATVAKNATETFNRIASTATVYMARTENTRFGVYSKETSDTAAVKLASDSMGAYAYSPMKASKFVDLPQAGGAFYEGRTMAMSMDGKSLYNGDISLQVRFRGKRVSGLVENLLDGDGDAFKYSFGTVAAIILAEATIGNDGDFMKDAERDSQIVFTAEPGSPQAEILEDRQEQVDGEVVPVTGSSFSGQFVGGGAAAIGTWAINASTSDAENLTAAFGAEQGDAVPVTAPTVEGGGVSMTSVTDDISAVDEKGVITLVPAVEADSNNNVAAVPAVTVKGADLFDTGGAEMNGDSFVANVIKEINSLTERLNAFIALDELEDEEAADSGRIAVWAALVAAIEPLVGVDSGAQIFADTYAGANAPDDSERDADAKELIDRVLDALSSFSKFRTATEEDGVLYGTGNGIITGSGAKKRMIFERVMSTTTVEFESTKYTRFGAWNRVATVNATLPPEDNANGVFAYSPLDATAYGTTDPNFPGGGKATYLGATIARVDQSDTPANMNTYYEGTITIGVTWAPNVDSADNVGNIAASISNLRDDDGALYMHITNGVENGVEIILFVDSDINVARDENDNTLSFGKPTTGIRLRHADIRLPDFGIEGNIAGLFVGKVIDGPLGVIGSWGLVNGDGDNLKGAYGADLAP